MAAPLAQEAGAYEVVEGEPPELLGRNLVSLGHLLASATAFFFLAFVFAYFYLRSLNSHGMWKPKGVDTSIAWGSVVVACYVASAVLVRLGLADHRALRRPAWRLKGAAALVVALAGLVVQVIGWTQQGFGPVDGGFASVYFGWTAFMFLFVLGTSTGSRRRSPRLSATGRSRAARPRRGRRPATATGPGTTSATRSRSSARSSSRSASTGRSWRGSQSSPGSSSTSCRA